MAFEFSPIAQAVFDALKEGVVVFDSDGRMVYANQAGQAPISELAEKSSPNSSQLLARLTNVGARVAALRVGDLAMGHAAFLPPSESDRDTLADRERQAILLTLEGSGWRLAESARRLGISRTTLWRRLKDYGLRRDGRGRWSRAS